MPIGQKVKMYYDPRGNVIRTVNPDASEQWVIHGKPDTLESVAINNKNYTPTPWESYAYDANDLATTAGLSATGHDFTPNSVVVDALGRNVKTIAWLLNGDKNEFKYQYDVNGNVLQAQDALERSIFINKFDLRKQVLATKHLDAGVQTSVFDVAAKPIEANDQKGAKTLSVYDTISRPLATFAKDKAAEDFTVRRYSLYGDDANSGLANPAYDNFLGKLYKQYDESGMNVVLDYDFKGNITAKKKLVIKDSLLLDAINDGTNNNWQIAPYRAEWTLTPWNEEVNLLEGDYQTDTSYDALNRTTQITYPADVNSDRKTLTSEYNKAGLLEKVKLGNDEYVSRIAYNAKGQRLLIAYGNGVMTRCAYDKKTFRLKRYRTEIFSQTGLQYATAGSVKEDRVYQYDLVGNVLKTNDNYTGCGLPANPDTLLKQFKYDELYRLLEATGREYDSSPTNPWDDIYPSADPNTTTFYRRIFTYDKMGNTQSMQHVGSNNFTRDFTYNNNRINQLTIGSDTYDYVYDNNGNLIKEFSNRFFEWDFTDKLHCFYNQANSGTEPTIYEQYLYDAAGTRIKKLTRRPSGVYEVTVYIDGIFEYHKRVNGTTQEKNYIHVMDDKKRIAEIRIESFSDDDNKPVKYLLEDHLQSVSARLDENGTVIDREEFYPYGESSVTTFSRKRFRFTSKERDSYSGLYYYGARYYSCWTQTFLSIDPAHAKTYIYSPYAYANCNPVVFNDPTGMTGQNQTNSNAEKPKKDDNKTEKGNGKKENVKTYSTVIEIYQSKDSEGNLIENTTTTYNDVKGADPGILIKVHNTDEHTYKEKYIPAVEIKPTYTFTEKFVKGVEKLDEISWNAGNKLGEKIEKYAGPVFNKIDKYMKSASQVGFNIEGKVEFNKYSAGAKVGAFSTSETNGGIEASANYTVTGKVKASLEKGISSTFTDFDIKLGLKINFYVSHGEANKDAFVGGVRNATIGEVKGYIGPAGVSHDTKGIDQFSIELGSVKPDAGVEFGVKNQTKAYYNTKLFNLGY